jgi:hypothetical protein
MSVSSFYPLYRLNPSKKIRKIGGHKNTQNEPNFRFRKIAISPYLLKTQGSSRMPSVAKTKPNPNPTKPNSVIPDPDPEQSRFDPIRAIRSFVVDKNGAVWDKLGVTVDNVGVILDKLGVIVDNVGVSNVTHWTTKIFIFDP